MRRLAAPLASRAADAARRKKQDEPGSQAARVSALPPRIKQIAARHGFLHPAHPQDIRRLLDCIGAEARYGLRSIELRQAPTRQRAPVPIFGRLDVPGRIVLYEQPEPPWRLAGVLSEHNARRMAQAGALIDYLPALELTQVQWPGDSLRRFMLIVVLLHEIGHHVFQHHGGKRPARRARTRDHEAFAEGYVARWQAPCLAALG
jgi:hypothetical protein